MGTRRRLIVATVIVVTVLFVGWVLVVASGEPPNDVATISSFALTTRPAPTTFIGGPRRWCDAASDPVQSGSIQVPALEELSGAVMSRRHENLVWVHNDSGDRARIFGIDTAGNLRVEVRLPGVEATDWEDITLIPGTDGVSDTIVVADFGDNLARRDSVRLVRFAEPGVPVDPAIPLRVTDASVEIYVYDDHPHDAEALFYDPTSRDLFVVTKENVDTPQLFLVGPSLGDESRSLQHLGPVEAPVAQLVTGADASPDGAAILLRTYEEVLVYEHSEDESMADVLARRPCQAPAPIGGQSEAIAIAPDGSGYYVFDEGVGSSIWFVSV